MTVVIISNAIKYPKPSETRFTRIVRIDRSKIRWQNGVSIRGLSKQCISVQNSAKLCICFIEKLTVVSGFGLKIAMFLFLGLLNYYATYEKEIYKAFKKLR